MQITASAVRYIKLGTGGRWDDVSLDHGEIHFGHRSVPHDMALRGDREEIKGHMMRLGRTASATSDDAREVIDFYHQGVDCLWIIFARDRLWWAFASPDIIFLGDPSEVNGARKRRTLDGWCSTDANGIDLRNDTLSTKLTQVSSYRRTLCAAPAPDYVLRRINGIVEPIVADANAARKTMIDIVERAVANLHWQDFETLVDIAFARNGWFRTSALGGMQKMIDLSLEQAATSERAAVQVKSGAGQSVLNDYIAQIDAAGTFDRLFFVCHSPDGSLSAGERSDIHVWAGPRFAEMVVRPGLHDWVLDKIA